MKFEIKKNVVDIKEGNQIYFRIKDAKTLAAFKKAQLDANKKAAELAQEMITHCLKEAGYL